MLLLTTIYHCYTHSNPSLIFIIKISNKNCTIKEPKVSVKEPCSLSVSTIKVRGNISSAFVLLKYLYNKNGAIYRKSVQLNPSKADTLGPPHFVHYSEVSFIEGLCLILN